MLHVYVGSSETDIISQRNTQMTIFISIIQFSKHVMNCGKILGEMENWSYGAPEVCKHTISPCEYLLT